MSNEMKKNLTCGSQALSYILPLSLPSAAIKPTIVIV